MNDPLLGYLAAGKDAAHVANLQADFAAALARMLGDAPGAVTINSGYRSVERQAQLWEEALAKYGDPEVADDWVARPGTSNHNFGAAVDLAYADDATKAWVHENAARYGLAFPMAHEPWHIEMAPDGQGGMTPVMVADAGPGRGPSPIEPAAPTAPSIASVLASGLGGPRSGPASASAPAQAQPSGTGQNVAALQSPNVAALLDELQMAASAPALNRRRLPQLLG